MCDIIVFNELSSISRLMRDLKEDEELEEIIMRKKV